MAFAIFHALVCCFKIEGGILLALGQFKRNSCIQVFSKINQDEPSNQGSAEGFINKFYGRDLFGSLSQHPKSIVSSRSFTTQKY